jgi:hypothetical protein
MTRAPRGSDEGFGVPRGGREGGNSNNQATEGWRSMWICGSVYKGIYRTVGKRSKLYRHSLMAPGKQGPADFDSVKQQKVVDLCGSVYKAYTGL